MPIGNRFGIRTFGFRLVKGLTRSVSTAGLAPRPIGWHSMPRAIAGLLGAFAILTILTQVVFAATPEAPKDLRAEAGNGAIMLTWDIAIATSTVDFFEYRQTTATTATAAPDFTNSLAIRVDGSASTTVSHVVSFLENDQIYHFQLRAVNSDGNSDWSNTASAEPSDASGPGGECDNGFAVPNPDEADKLVEDCNVLLDIESSLDPGNLLNWDVDRPIRMWDGITVSGDSGDQDRVSELVLSRVPLNGRISERFGELTGLVTLNIVIANLAGEIPSKLGDLGGLRDLDLRRNNLSGPIPVELGNLTELLYLNLWSNDLSGTIPVQLGGLDKLEELGLSFNDLSGSIPPQLGNLAKLFTLNLSFNGLTGGIPAELGKLRILEFLSVSDNQLSGEIPSEIVGPSDEMPSEIVGLKDVTRLLLAENSFTGDLPEGICDETKMPRLENVTIDGNDDLSTFPPGCRNITIPRATPRFLADRLLTFAEGDTGAIATLTAIDEQGHGIKWSLPYHWEIPYDVAAFEITPAGVLSFKSVPDFENPADTEGDNEYILYVITTDDGVPTRSGPNLYFVTVTNVNEPPTAAGGIQDFTMQETDSSRRYENLQSYFSDPDGDNLELEVSSTNPTVVRVSIADGGLTIARVGERAGVATVAVTATDPDGESAKLSFKVTVESSVPQGGGGSGGVVSTPTPRPRPTATPVAIAVVPLSEITIVPVSNSRTQRLAVVDPSEQTTVASPNGRVRITFPRFSRERTYQVLVDSSPENCTGGEPVDGTVNVCMTVDFFDTEGNPETNVTLITAASGQMILRPQEVQDLGGIAALFQAHVLGGLTVVKRGSDFDAWTPVRYTFELTGDGGALVSLPAVRTFSSFAWAIDDTILQRSILQVTGAATRTPIPTPTATQTAVPPVTATPADVKSEPDIDVGDVSLPRGLLLVVVFAAGLLLIGGTRLIRGRRSGG